MEEEKEERNNQIPRVRGLTKLAMIFLFIAGLLVVASVLPSTLIITTITSKTAFAQQHAEEEEEKQSVEKQAVSSSITTNRKPTEIISKIRILLNQSINEYRKQNFTGAQELATSAYLDNFEFIETPLKKRDNALENNIEMMLREQLRQYIKDRLPLENIQQLITKIRSNLDKAEKLLPDTSIQTSRSATQANMTNSSTNTVLPRTPALNTSNKVLIAGDESDKPYMPGSITIKTGDKVGWINTDEEVHTVTSGFENNTDKGKQFDSGLLNNNQTFEHTFDKAGTYNYFCTVHPTMTGVVNVK